MKDPRDIILGPIVSEKSYDLIEQRGTYTFQVDPRTNKTEVKQAVQAIFGVKVDRVNIINRKGKRKRTGFMVGRRNDTKRALVTLAEGQTIDIFGVK
ncbi:MAG TPA: 50S ribosomal protein L23 [Acidimicrobiia bacterium]|nr:50S ribosomal protein L23 [Acidimicrobiia bacterium]